MSTLGREGNTNPVAVLRDITENGVEYQSLFIWCPGCDCLHGLPVNTTEKTPQWTFNGNLSAPTLEPSILTRMGDMVCHSYLRNGIWQFLGDSTHSLSGQNVQTPPLPDWFVGEENDR